MTTKRQPTATEPLPPIRVAPPGPLSAYTIYEHELDIMAAGSPATLAINFAIALISIGVSLFLTLTTTTIGSNRLYYGYLIACINCVLAGIIMFAYWLRTRSSVSVTVAKIKARLPVAAAIQDAPTPADPTGPA